MHRTIRAVRNRRRLRVLLHLLLLVLWLLLHLLLLQLLLLRCLVAVLPALLDAGRLNAPLLLLWRGDRLRQRRQRGRQILIEQTLLQCWCTQWGRVIASGLILLLIAEEVGEAHAARHATERHVLASLTWQSM